jgi:hypothetical protein
MEDIPASTIQPIPCCDAYALNKAKRYHLILAMAPFCLRGRLQVFL